MADVELVIFDDAVARNWYPFTLTRPAGELLLGTLTLRERLERVIGAKCAGHLTAADLAGFDEPGSPRVLDAVPHDQRTRIYLSSRLLLQWDVTVDVSQEATLRVGDHVAGWVIPPNAPPPTQNDLLTPGGQRGNRQTIDGTVLHNVWDLIHHNPDQVATDILHFFPNARSAAPPQVHLIGKYPLMCGEGVAIEPGVVFDLTAGPVWLDDGVQVRALSRIAGPMYVGKGTLLFGGLYTASSIGARCKVHGELEESIILGYSNKAHEGFLGHAYVGKWVNLGALTTNSDLKNNYSTVRITTPGGEVDTGLTKLGSLIGDHVKTAIGTMINTGTVVGPGANLFGGMPPKHVAPFSWGGGEYELEKFLETATRAMYRREIELSSSQRDMLSRIWQNTRRDQADRESVKETGR